MIHDIAVLIVGAAIGVSGLFGGAWAQEQWHKRKRVSYLDQAKAEKLLYDRAVDGMIHAHEESLQYRFGYEGCLNALFDASFADRVSRTAEMKWLNKKYPTKGVKA